MKLKSIFLLFSQIKNVILVGRKGVLKRECKVNTGLFPFYAKNSNMYTRSWDPEQRQLNDLTLGKFQIYSTTSAIRAYVCLTPWINMASILSLPDDCLYKIVCCMDEPSSFYTITLTCERFLQVAEDAKRALHTNLLRTKAEYFIKFYIVYITDETFVFPSDNTSLQKYIKLRDLLHDSVRLTAARGVLSYDRVIDVWQRNGAVVATLFTWVRKLESRVDEGKFRTDSSFAVHQNVTLHLPNCGKSMVIEASHFGDYVQSHDPELSIHITCGDLRTFAPIVSAHPYCARNSLRDVIHVMH